jgi:plastocyanin domain-containing protein
MSGCATSGSKTHEVQVNVTDDGFQPREVAVDRGMPATLVITRTAEATCATEVVFEKSGQKYELPLRQAVRIPLETGAPDTLRYACGMDMYHARVIVK